MKRIIIIISIIFSAPTFALQNEFLLRVGAELAYYVADSDKSKFDNTIYNVGISAQVGYIFKKFEMGISSHVYTGAIGEFELEAQGETLTGKGTVAIENFTLYFKYFTDLYPFKFWRLYGTIGPSVSFNTIKLREFTTTSPDYTHNHKITTDSVGMFFALGIEENALRKTSRPNYIQLSYSAHRPTSFDVVDATNYTQVESIYQSESGLNLIIQTIMFEVGFVLF